MQGRAATSMTGLDGDFDLLARGEAGERVNEVVDLAVRLCRVSSTRAEPIMPRSPRCPPPWGWNQVSRRRTTGRGSLVMLVTTVVPVRAALSK
jgi:hypothetical protein